MITFNDKVKARANIAAALREQFKALGVEVGLLDDDLAVVVDDGRNAEKADADQKSQLAEGSAGITIKAQDIEKVLDGNALVRAKLPAVVSDLIRAGHTQLALTVQRLSFDRFRIREIKPPADAAPPSDSEADELKKLERVAREDHLSQLAGLANWIDAIRAPGREAVVAAFAARKTSDEELAKLSADARALSEQGRNVRRAVEATKREHDAVEAQTERWHAIKRLVKLAAQREPELQRLFASC